MTDSWNKYNEIKRAWHSGDTLIMSRGDIQTIFKQVEELREESDLVWEIATDAQEKVKLLEARVEDLIYSHNRLLDIVCKAAVYVLNPGNKLWADERMVTKLKDLLVDALDNYDFISDDDEADEETEGGPKVTWPSPFAVMSDFVISELAEAFFPDKEPAVTPSNIIEKQKERTERQRDIAESMVGE